MVVHGFVQGVFFRDTTRRVARQHGVSGWVRNRRDGAVEAVFEGDEDAVAQLIRFAHDGPRGARVDRVEIYEEQPEGTIDFSVR